MLTVVRLDRDAFDPADTGERSPARVTRQRPCPHRRGGARRRTSRRSSPTRAKDHAATVNTVLHQRPNGAAPGQPRPWFALLITIAAQERVLAGQVEAGFGQHPDAEIYPAQWARVVARGRSSRSGRLATTSAERVAWICVGPTPSTNTARPERDRRPSTRSCCRHRDPLRRR